MSAEVTPTTTAIIAGITGTLGPSIKREMEGRGYTVYGGSRGGGDFQYTSSQLTDSNYWYDQISNLAGNSDKVEIVNLIGQPHARSGSTLEDVNVRPPEAMVTAARDFAQNHPEKKVVMVQVSAIAAKYLADDAYGHSRAEADRIVNETATKANLDNFKSVVLQFPFLYTKPNEQGEIRGLHKWSMEQVAGLPIIPVVNGGNQILFPLSKNDAVHAIANCVDVEKSQVIEMKGADPVTNREMIRLYAQIEARNPSFITLPAEPMGLLLDQFNYGLLDGYGPRLMARLSDDAIRETPDPTDEILGKPAEGIRELANVPAGTKLASPPIGEHMAAHKMKLGAISLIGLLSIAGIGLFMSNRNN